MTMYGYIYITTNTINNKKYIGKHVSSVFEPEKYLGSGRTLLKAIKKYGKDKFICELLEWCNDKDSLNERERFWINKCNAIYDKMFYNISEGGDGASKGDLNPAKAEVVRKKISDNNSMKNPVYRKHLSDAKKGKKLPHTKEWNENISKALSGRKTHPLSDTTKNKISLANSGSNNGMYGKSAVVGTKWFNDGIKNIRATTCPIGFVPGVLRKSRLYPGE